MKTILYIMNKILIGSNYFFKSFDDFDSKDKDFLRIVDKGNGYKFIRQQRINGDCYFDVVKMNKNDFIDYTLKSKGPAMKVGKFLIPEFNKEFDITINDLKKLQPLIDKLDDKHKYEKIIFDSYIENNKFILTDNQLEESYNKYKKTRKLNGETIHNNR